MYKGWAKINGDDWTRPELPHDHSSQLVEHTMSKVGIIIAKCQKVSLYFAARRGSLARALTEICDDAAGS